MKKILLIVLLTNCLCFAQTNFLTDRIYLKVLNGIDLTITYDYKGTDTIALTGIEAIDDLNYSNNCNQIERLFTGEDAILSRWYIFYFNTSSVEDVKESYDYLGDYVESTDLVYINEVGWIPNDPMFDNTYHKAFFDSKIPSAWNVQQGNTNLLIGIIDNGLDWNHPDISIDNIWQNLGEDSDNDGKTIYIAGNGSKQFDLDDLNGIDDDGNGRVDDLVGYNFYNGNHNIYSSLEADQHGLNMFGLVAANENNSLGAAGSSFNSKIIHCKVGGGGYIFSYVPAIQYLADMDVDVISMSFFGGSYMQSTQDVIDYAYSNGSIVIACGGYTTNNCPYNYITYPIGYNNVIGLGVLETDANNMRLSSIVSDKIDLLGSRTATYPAIENGQHSYKWSMHTSGTTAMTAGILSLLKAQYPTWTNDQIINQLFITAINKEDYNTSNSCNFDFTGLIGYGLVDAEYALLFNGSVDRDLIWNKDINVYHSIIVQSGKTLTIREGTNLNFEPNKTFNVYGNLVIEGDLTINRTINILSGGTITIEPGAKVTLTDNAQILVNGQISCIGTSSEPIEFDFVQPHLTYNQGIELVYGCTDADFDYTIIKNSRYGINSDRVYFTFYRGQLENLTYGIYVDRAKPDIQYNSFEDCLYGVRLHNTNYVTGTETKIWNNEFIMTGDHANSYGIYLYYSNPDIISNYISGYIAAISCNSYSAAKLGKEYYYGNNEITYNDYGLISTNSNPFLGAFYTGGPTNGRYNCLYDNYLDNIYATSSSTILAYGNWWGSYKESEILSKFTIVGGSSIAYQQWLTYCPITDASVQNQDEENQSISERMLGPINSLVDSIVYANILMNSNLSQGRLLLAQLITRNKGASGIDLALDYLWNSYVKNNELPPFISYINNLSNDPQKRHLIGNSKIIRAKMLNENLFNNLDQIIEIYNGTDVESYALYEKFITNYFTYNAVEEATLVYEDLLSRFPESELTKDARLVLFGPERSLERTNLNKHNGLNTNSYDLQQNYPNPFNPSTVINYDVKEAGLVRLKVYDILGAEVADLVNETKEAGYHSVEFNASQLPSGIYIYKLQAGDFVSSKKMILLK